MKISRLTIENVLRITAVDIEFDEHNNLVVIGGENGAGKSSVLQSVMMALGGKGEIPPVPVHRGAEKGKIVLDLGEFVVTRTFTVSGGTSVKVRSKDGATYQSPQSLLDAFYASLSFDPLEFARSKAGRQASTLKQLLGLDFDSMDEEREVAFAARTDINREVRRLEAQILGMPIHTDAPDEEVPTKTVLDQLDTARDRNDKNRRMREQADQFARGLAGAAHAAKEAEGQIEQLQLQLKGLVAERARMRTKSEDAEAALSELIDHDLDPLKERLGTLDADNRKVRENAARDEADKILEEKTVAASELSSAIEAIDARKAAMIAKADFPVPGLGVDEHGVTLDGLPFEQASTAQSLRVSLAIGMALNPRLKAILINRGSDLDATSMRLVAEMAAEEDYMVLMERVGEDSHTTVVIEDGAVRP